MQLSKIEREDIDYIIKNNGLEQLENSSFYITGVTGLLGAYFLKTIVALNLYYGKQHRIIILVRNLSKVDPELLNLDFIEVINQDVTEEAIIDGPVDYVIHTAGPASPKIMKSNPVGVSLANTLGTLHTLNIAKEKGAKGYLFISSREVYGEAAENQKYFTEDGRLGYVDHTVVRNCYAESKKNAENMIILYQHQYGLNAKAVRLAHTYGPGINIRDGRVQSDFLYNYMSDQDIVLKSSGESRRTYTYIADAISAMFRILLDSPQSEVIYNVSDEDNEVSIKELAEMIASIGQEHGKQLKTRFELPDDTQVSFAPFSLGLLSSAKLQGLGYKKSFGVREGFERTIAHLEEIEA